MLKISSNENGEITISENYVGLMMRASDQRVGVCERDGGFEINVIQPDGSHDWHSIVNGKIVSLKREGDAGQMKATNEEEA